MFPFCQMMCLNQLQHVCVSRNRVNKVRRVPRLADISVTTLLPEGDECDHFSLSTVFCISDENRMRNRANSSAGGVRTSLEE